MDERIAVKKALVDCWAVILGDLVQRHSSTESRQRESVRLRCGGEVFGYYHFNDEQLDRLLDLAELEKDAFEVAKREAARRMSLSREVPERLYRFAIEALAGNVKPTKKSTSNEDYLRVLVMCVTRDIEAQTGWARYYDQGTRPKNRHGFTACEVVEEALRKCDEVDRPRLDANKLNSLFLRGRLKDIAK